MIWRGKREIQLSFILYWYLPAMFRVTASCMYMYHNNINNTYECMRVDNDDIILLVLTIKMFPVLVKIV